MIYAPTLADLEAIALEEYEALPDIFKAHTQNLVIRVEDFPDEDVAVEMGLETPFDLLGLYQGVNLLQKSAFDTPHQPDMVFLYRRAILDYWCDTGEELRHVIRHVLIHEIGHHFGFSDADMDALERSGSPLRYGQLN